MDFVEAGLFYSVSAFTANNLSAAANTACAFGARPTITVAGFCIYARNQGNFTVAWGMHPTSC